MKGRNPKPDQLKKLEGTFRKDRERNPPQGTKIIKVEAPDHLNPSEREQFDFITRELIFMGTLEEVDMNLIFAYCIEAASYFNTTAYLKKVGHTFMTPTGVIVNRPEVTNARNNLANMITIGAKLGLSPVDRLKLSSAQKEPKPNDPFNGLL